MQLALAQWSTDTTINKSISSAQNDQSSNNSFRWQQWSKSISWYDERNDTSNIDIHAQRE
jgi:hypothetical protein